MKKDIPTYTFIGDRPVKSDNELALYDRTNTVDQNFCYGLRRDIFPGFSRTKSSSLMLHYTGILYSVLIFCDSQIHIDSFTSQSNKFLDVNIIFMKIQSLHEVEGFSTRDPGLEEILKNL